MINPNDITIVFCINDGLIWSRNAIKSFKICNPEFADRIVIFNDNFKSIDKLKRDVSEIITWKNFERNDNMLVRVGNMYQDIAMQINTKYLCFIDNDTVSHEKGWLTEILDIMQKNDAKIFSPIQQFSINYRGKENLPIEYKDIILNKNSKYLERFSYYSIVLNNHYLKENFKINGYLGNEKFYENDIFDIGTEFYYFCLKNNIEMINISDSDFNLKYLYHIRPNPINPSSATYYNEKLLTTKEAKELEKNKPVWKLVCNKCDDLGIRFRGLYDLI